MSVLYPLKFEPILKDKIWGGQKLEQLLGKDGGELPNIGESWELSGVTGDESTVANGFLEGNTLNELVEVYMGELVGEAVYERFGNEFPLLIKFIDAADDLSIQVHPDDKLAGERHGSYGKTEMWYVMQADAGARLIAGFNGNVDKPTYLKHLEANSLHQIMGYHEVVPGDVFFMPAGRVHAIGAGILLAEIQQTSDVTYRIYDFDRRDAKGNPRELHTELAMDAIDFKKIDHAKADYKASPNVSTNIVACPFFTTNIIVLDKPVERDYYPVDSFVIYICVEGAFEVSWGTDKKELVECGQTVLIPAEIDDVTLIPQKTARILEVYID
ncbi:MAG: mannose-6-phosphate isomerase [Breznakibacter sp.]